MAGLGRWTEEEAERRKARDERIVRFRKSGLSQDEIAHLIGVTQATVSRVLGLHGLDGRRTEGEAR